MAECSFCRKLVKSGTGLLYVKKDGSMFLFCSGKCEKNALKLKRNPAKTRWTETYHALKKPQEEKKHKKTEKPEKKEKKPKKPKKKRKRRAKKKRR